MFDLTLCDEVQGTDRIDRVEVTTLKWSTPDGT